MFTNKKTDPRYASEIPYWHDCWFEAFEQYLRNIPDDAEAIPIEAARDYAEVGDRINGRVLVRRLVPMDMFAVVRKES